ncbi:MAG: HU family DNA-binding protein [Faecalibacterium sp.]
MTKTDLIAQVAANTEMTKKDAERAVNAVFEALSHAMAEGEKITISGFGSFEVRERAERQGTNPRTREPMTIAASRNIVFKPGKSLKDSL